MDEEVLAALRDLAREGGEVTITIKAAQRSSIPQRGPCSDCHPVYGCPGLGRCFIHGGPRPTTMR